MKILLVKTKLKIPFHVVINLIKVIEFIFVVDYILWLLMYSRMVLHTMH